MLLLFERYMLCGIVNKTTVNSLIRNPSMDFCLKVLVKASPLGVGTPDAAEGETFPACPGLVIVKELPAFPGVIMA